MVPDLFAFGAANCGAVFLEPLFLGSFVVSLSRCVGKCNPSTRKKERVFVRRRKKLASGSDGHIFCLDGSVDGLGRTSSI
jgi:hypothetical protein